MNERIKELAEQAGITTNIDTNYYEKDMNKWVDYFSEQFAELIVQECILTIQMDITRDGHNTEKYIRSMKHINQIKERFGVK